MSTLLAIGDSHTFGSEIYGEGDNRPESIYKAYPEKLRQLLESFILLIINLIFAYSIAKFVIKYVKVKSNDFIK